MRVPDAGTPQRPMESPRRDERSGGTAQMTDRAEIETRVKKVLAEQLAVDEVQVVPDARFQEDLNADSLDLVEAVLALEEEWSIEIPEDEMESVKTVGQAIDLVSTKLGIS
jgi:acyl carrier protein